MKTIGLWESVEYLKESIDPTNRTVKQIVIRAGKSKNNRHYPETALKEAVFLFENSQTYQNHPSKTDLKQGEGRKVEDLSGWLTDIHYDESQKAIVATRHFTENVAGQNTWSIVKQVVENNAPPSLIGGSINALGRGKKQDDGSVLVEAITQVISVDDVTSPAAGGGFEKLIASDGGIVQAVFESMDYQEWCESRPDYYEQLQKEMKLVRHSKAIKTVQAEADEKVKTAMTEADRLRETAQEAQDAIAEEKKAHEATLTELIKARRELLIERTLQKTRLPVEWRDSLRHRLLESDPDQWESIIADEQQKAKRVNKPQIGNMSTRRVHESVSVASSPTVSLRPMEGEDFNAWRKRIDYMKVR